MFHLIFLRHGGCEKWASTVVEPIILFILIFQAAVKLLHDLIWWQMYHRYTVEQANVVEASAAWCE